MGIEYYLVDHTNKELFDLGKGSWSMIDFRNFKKEASKLLEYEDVHVVYFCAKLVNCCYRSFRDMDYEELTEYVINFGFDLYDWCEKCDWDIYLLNDCVDDIPFDTYKITGDRYRD